MAQRGPAGAAQSEVVARPDAPLSAPLDGLAGEPRVAAASIAVLPSTRLIASSSGRQGPSLPPSLEFEVLLSSTAESAAIHWYDTMFAGTPLITVLHVATSALPAGHVGLSLHHGDYLAAFDNQSVVGMHLGQVVKRIADTSYPHVLRVRRFVPQHPMTGMLQCVAAQAAPSQLGGLLSRNSSLGLGMGNVFTVDADARARAHAGRLDWDPSDLGDARAASTSRPTETATQSGEAGHLMPLLLPSMASPQPQRALFAHVQDALPPADLSSPSYFTARLEAAALAAAEDAVRRISDDASDGASSGGVPDTAEGKSAVRRANLRGSATLLADTYAKQTPTSVFRGVYRRAGRWSAQIQHDGRKVYLGSFATEVEAARAYDDAALRLHGNRALVNFGSSYRAAADASLMGE